MRKDFFHCVFGFRVKRICTAFEIQKSDFSVILNCLRQDITLSVAYIFSVILNLFQELASCKFVQKPKNI